MDAQDTYVTPFEASLISKEEKQSPLENNRFKLNSDTTINEAKSFYWAWSLWLLASIH